MNIGVFYHARLSGGNRAIDPNFGRAIFAQQLAVIHQSGLLAEAKEFYIGLNGSETDANWTQAAMPSKAHLLWHGPNSESLLPTFHHMEKWVRTHPGWLLCFFHTKGVTHPGNELYAAWRTCMEWHVLWNWRKCVADLESGHDSSGCHWLTPERYPGTVHRPFWGGAFWWVTADFMAGQPLLIREIKTPDDWFEPEHWIGNQRRPKVRDHHAEWPNTAGCLKGGR